MEDKNRINESNESEDKIKQRLKAEIMAEILEEMKEKEPDQDATDNRKENGPVNAHNPVQNNTMYTQEKKKDTVAPKEEKLQNTKNDKAEDLEIVSSKATIVILVIAIVVIGIAIFFFPSIYRYVLDKSAKSNYVEPSNSNDIEEPIYEKITVDSPVLNNFTYPIMRNSQYQKDSYYQRPSLTMSDFSNNDILYNAFIYVYQGAIAEYKGGYSGTYCGNNNTKKVVNAKYIDARIKNLFTKNTVYNHGNFTVPSTNTKTPYVGTWKYDAKQNAYVYYGDCVGVKPSNAVYYDLMSIYNAEGLSNNTIIEVSYYMGFAEVNSATKGYIIYADANMTNILSSGTLTTGNYAQELQNIFNTYLQNEHSAKSYKYTFSTNDCSYKDYCFVKGEWLN